MPFVNFPTLNGSYHDQMLFMQALASAVSDPKKICIVLEGAATLTRHTMLNTPVWIQRVTLSNGSTAMAASTNTTAIDFSQWDNITPTKIGTNSIAVKAAATAVTALLSLALTLSTVATDMVVAAGSQIRAAKTIVGTQADCVVEFEYYDVATGFVPS